MPNEERDITTITRRNIIDAIRLSEIAWNGRLEEVEFLHRIFPLEEMPSTDSRFSSMDGDINKHRVWNNDWPDDWVFTDKRLDLLHCDDSTFLKFLCETIHPLVRVEPGEIQTLLEIYNKQLEADGYEIYQAQKVSGKPLFEARSLGVHIRVHNLNEFGSAFLKEQIDKCDAKLTDGDYDGAITNARSLVEAVLGEIHQRATGEELQSTGDLLKDYKAIKDSLNLSEEKISHESIKGMIRSFYGIMQGIDTLSNKMGDRHRPTLKPLRHHAKLAVDSAKAISDFLYSVMIYQENRVDAFLEGLLDELDSDDRFLPREDLLAKRGIAALMARSDPYVRRYAKERLLGGYEVNSYRRSDIYFAVLRIFFDDLTQSDIEAVYIEAQTNSQMVGWKEFERLLLEENPKLLQKAYDNIYG